MNEPDRNTCKHVQGQLHFLNELASASPERRALEAHVHNCAACAAEWRNLRVLLAALGKLQAPAMRPEFASQAFAQVRRQAARTRWQKPAYAVAASAMLVGVLLVIQLTQVPQNTAPAYDLVVAAPIANEAARDLRIAFNSPGELANVGIEIVLPEGLELVGSSTRSVSWQTHLYKGKNELKLPLVNAGSNASAVEHVVLARLTHGDKVKEFRVRLQKSEQV